MAVTNRTDEPVATRSDEPVATRTDAPAGTRTDEPVPTRADAPAAAGERTVVDDRDAAPRRRLGRRRGARAGAAVAAAGAGTSLLIARLVRLIAGVVALILALGIVFVVFKASPSNTIVSHVHDWAHWLATPFNGLFHLHSARGTVALNWGIALVVYLLVGHLIARIIATPARVVHRHRRAAAVCSTADPAGSADGCSLARVRRARQLAPLGAVERDLPQSHGVGRHLDALVGAQKLERLIEGQLPLRHEPDELVCR